LFKLSAKSLAMTIVQLKIPKAQYRPTPFNWGAALELVGRLAVALDHLERLVVRRGGDGRVGSTGLLGGDGEANAAECPEKRLAKRSAMSSAVPVVR
jgi:hypothetical protein